MFYISTCLNREIYMQTHNDLPKNKRKESGRAYLKGRRTMQNEEKGRTMRWGKRRRRTRLEGRGWEEKRWWRPWGEEEMRWGKERGCREALTPCPQTHAKSSEHTRTLVSRHWPLCTVTLSAKTGPKRENCRKTGGNARGKMGRSGSQCSLRLLSRG